MPGEKQLSARISLEEHKAYGANAKRFGCNGANPLAEKVLRAAAIVLKDGGDPIKRLQSQSNSEETFAKSEKVAKEGIPRKDETEPYQRYLATEEYIQESVERMEEILALVAKQKSEETTSDNSGKKEAEEFIRKASARFERQFTSFYEQMKELKPQPAILNSKDKRLIESSLFQAEGVLSQFASIAVALLESNGIDSEQLKAWQKTIMPNFSISKFPITKE